MWVGEKEEECGEGLLREVVWHELHGVSADDRDVLVGARRGRVGIGRGG